MNTSSDKEQSSEKDYDFSKFLFGYIAGIASIIGILISTFSIWNWNGLLISSITLGVLAIVTKLFLIYLKRKSKISRLMKEISELRTIDQKKTEEITLKDDLIKSYEATEPRMCDFCSTLEDGDELMNQGEHERALKIYEEAIDKRPEHFRGAQRIALLEFISGSQGRIQNPFDLFKKTALKYYAQFSVQRALSYIEREKLNKRGLHEISHFLHAVKITGNTRLFSLLTDSKKETTAFGRAMRLHIDARDTYKKIQLHYYELIKRYLDILMKPEAFDPDNIADEEKIDLELASTCKGCPFNLRCLYTFSDVILSALSLSKEEREANTITELFYDINRRFAPDFLGIFRKYEIRDENNNLIGWPSVILPNILDLQGNPSTINKVDPYVTSYILRYISTNDEFGLEALSRSEIIRCLHKICDLQNTDKEGSHTLIAGSHEDEKIYLLILVVPGKRGILELIAGLYS